MKCIDKTVIANPMFGQWKKVGGWDASEPSSKTFDPQAQNLKQQVKKLLLSEQGYICCYCESRITEEKSHIEHLQPRSLFPTLKEEYSNLFCSCKYNNSCGNTKGNSIIKVFPLQKTCGDVFEYKDNGKIEGIGTDAVDTINVLRLDCEKLNATRYEMVYVFLNEMSNVTPIEFDMWIDDYLKPDANGHFRPFWSTVKSMAKEYHP